MSPFPLFRFLHLPAAPRRALKRAGPPLIVLFVFLLSFFLVWFYLLEGLLPAVLALGAVEIMIFLGAVALMAAPYLKRTSVLLTNNRAVVKTALYRTEKIREYTLNEKSRARQWYSPRVRYGRDTPDDWGPQGIELGSDPYNPEVDDIDLSDESKPRFGEKLPTGELDWLEWRINQFLDQAAMKAVVGSTPTEPIEGIPEKAVPPPKNTFVRIVENPFESRIIFPALSVNRSC